MIRFFEAYHKEGIQFWGMTMANEPISGGSALNYKWQALYFDAVMER